MSSHIFEEVERSCDRAGIIREGKIVDVENVKALGDMKAKMYVISFGSSADAKTFHSSHYDTSKISETQVKVSVSYPYQQFFQMLSTYDVTELEMRQESLEDVFMKYYGEAGGTHE
ncbi:MAG: hypothetical protein U9N81_10295 [Bacillota bacterium]|nr:hypothetical protein [Bacillota bacterium]